MWVRVVKIRHTNLAHISCVCMFFFRLSHKKKIRSINRNASLRVAIEFPNLFFSISFETLFPNQFPHGNQFKCLAVTRLQTKMCWIYSSNQVFMFTENKSNKEIIIWDIWFQRPFRKPKNSIYLLLQHEAFRIEGYIYIYVWISSVGNGMGRIYAEKCIMFPLGIPCNVAQPFSFCTIV